MIGHCYFCLCDKELFFSNDQVTCQDCKKGSIRNPINVTDQQEKSSLMQKIAKACPSEIQILYEICDEEVNNNVGWLHKKIYEKDIADRIKFETQDYEYEDGYQEIYEILETIFEHVTSKTMDDLYELPLPHDSSKLKSYLKCVSEDEYNGSPDDIKWINLDTLGRLYNMTGLPLKKKQKKNNDPDYFQSEKVSFHKWVMPDGTIQTEKFVEVLK